MVIADMYSKKCFVQKMPSARVTLVAIISKMKEIFAEHEVPDIVRSDNMQVLHLLSSQKDEDFNTLHQVFITQLQMDLKNQW